MANQIIEIRNSYNCKFYLTTDLELQGRGIKQSGDGRSHARGMKTYHATEAALNKLKEQYQTIFITD